MAAIHPVHILCPSTAQQTPQRQQPVVYQSSLTAISVYSIADLSGFVTGLNCEASGHRKSVNRLIYIMRP
jgi:hypothetical protein